MGEAISGHGDGAREGVVGEVEAVEVEDGGESSGESAGEVIVREEEEFEGVKRGEVGRESAEEVVVFEGEDTEGGEGKEGGGEGGGEGVGFEDEFGDAVLEAGDPVPCARGGCGGPGWEEGVGGVYGGFEGE